ncbi:MAG: DUF4178 domain-containing protein [Opitutae bacterium]|nr:DUF4178 domain-containing protein [Opitutae bacterium]
MSRNPTALRVGMSGLLRGRRYTVRGWVVFSVVVDGETYYWTEFNVADERGVAATLVFEETEDGPTWKWFTLLEPRRPLTIAEAAAKRAGDTVEFEGRQIPITLVSESHAVEIEGEAPGGVLRGEVARYFNADAGEQRLFVATWLGEKIEFYIGQTIGRKLVESAFGLPPTKSFNENFSSATSDSSADLEYVKNGAWALVVLGVFALRFIFENYDPEPDVRFAAPPAMTPAPASGLAVGARGTLVGRTTEVVEYADGEVAMRGARFHANEFLLRVADRGEALLVQGWRGDPNHWLLLRPIVVPATFTPTWAGGLRRGSGFQVEGRRFETVDVWLERPKPAKGVRAGTPWAQSTLYGLVARNGEEWLLCRWDEKEIRWYLGRALSAATVAAAFPRS